MYWALPIETTLNMHEHDLNRVEFYSNEDMAGSSQLLKAEPILKGDKQPNYSDINDILELYNIKKYFDNELYLKNWTQENIVYFIKKSTEFGKDVGLYQR
mgnify:CR=1 FL=1